VAILSKKDLAILISLKTLTESLGNAGFIVINSGHQYREHCLGLLRETILFAALDESFINRLIKNDEDIVKEFFNNPYLRGSSRASRAVCKSKVISIKPELLRVLNDVGIDAKDLINDDVYFRYVTPDDKPSQSIVHRDAWFHKITDGWDKLNENSNLKIWTPLLSANRSTGLGVIPGSHLHETDQVRFSRDEQGNKRFESFTELSTADLSPIKVPIGHSIVFPSNLLHGGLDIMEWSPRLSVEITIQL